MFARSPAMHQLYPLTASQSNVVFMTLSTYATTQGVRLVPQENTTHRIYLPDSHRMVEIIYIKAIRELVLKGTSRWIENNLRQSP